MSLVENTAWPWFKLSVFAPPHWLESWESWDWEERRTPRGKRKQEGIPQINFLARPSDWISSCRWRQKPRERNAELVEEQRNKKLGLRMTCSLRISLRISRPSLRLLVSHCSLGRLWAQEPRRAPSPLRQRLSRRRPWCPRPAAFWWCSGSRSLPERRSQPRSLMRQLRIQEFVKFTISPELGRDVAYYLSQIKPSSGKRRAEILIIIVESHVNTEQ